MLLFIPHSLDLLFHFKANIIFDQSRVTKGHRLNIPFKRIQILRDELFIHQLRTYITIENSHQVCILITVLHCHPIWFRDVGWSRPRCGFTQPLIPFQSIPKSLRLWDFNSGLWNQSNFITTPQTNKFVLHLYSHYLIQLRNIYLSVVTSGIFNYQEIMDIRRMPLEHNLSTHLSSMG